MTKSEVTAEFYYTVWEEPSDDIASFSNISLCMLLQIAGKVMTNG